MTHVNSLSKAHLDQPSIVTIGVFDGVHKGHQHLIKTLVDEAHSTGHLAVVLTFFPHPDIVLKGLNGRYYLTTPQQKAELLADLGVDCVVTHPFSDEVRQVRAAEFVDQLRDHLKMASLWVGSDFAMGYKREGTVPFLREQGQVKGFTVHDVNLLQDRDGAISSSLIRKAIQDGDMEQARTWLGRAYSVTGEVIHGEKRGRQIGYPTANTDVWDQQVLPAHGIYAGWAWVENERYMAMTNVGIRPTFDGKNITVEPYLLDFNRDIYGQQLVVSFEKRLRPEAKFDNLQALIEQIGHDVEQGRAYLESLPY